MRNSITRGVLVQEKCVARSVVLCFTACTWQVQLSFVDLARVSRGKKA